MAGEDRSRRRREYIDFNHPSRYALELAVEGDVATLTMDVDENAACSRLSAQADSYDSASTSTSPTPCSGCARAIPMKRW